MLTIVKQKSMLEGRRIKSVRNYKQMHERKYNSQEMLNVFIK